MSGCAGQSRHKRNAIIPTRRESHRPPRLFYSAESIAYDRVMEKWRSDRIGSALRGENPTVLRRLQAGFAIIGDLQFLPGYCVLLTDAPDVQRLSDLPRGRRMEFLTDLDLLAEVVERVCARRDPEFRRANLSILGNLDPFLHAHVVPRYNWEPAEFHKGPIDLYPVEQRNDPKTALGPQHDGLRAELAAEIDLLSR